MVRILAKDNEDPFDDPEVVDSVLVALCVALYYNSALTLNSLQQSGMLFFFMSKLGDAVTARKKKTKKLIHFQTKRYKKRIILGLASIIASPADVLPAGIGNSLPQIASAAIALSIALKEQENSSTNESARSLHPSSEGYLPDSGDDDDDDESYGDARAHALRAAKLAAGFDEDDDDWSDYWDGYSDNDDDVDIQSPLDNVCPFNTYGLAMLHYRQSNAAGFDQMLASLDDASRGALAEIMNASVPH